MTFAQLHESHGMIPQSSCCECRKAFQGTILRWPQGLSRSFSWRRKERTNYELVVAEVLLQQTRAENVDRVFDAITCKCPDWHALAMTPVGDLEELLKPLGLQRRRSASLHALAESVIQNGLPVSASALEKLPGIGQYIARAIAVQLSKEVAAPIDTNITRVLERVFGPRKLADIRHDSELQGLALSLVPPSDPGGYFVALLDFAAMVCRSRAPRCHECPLQACQFKSAIKRPQAQASKFS